MATGNSVARSRHDLSLAAWFAGSLMGAIGLNRTAAALGATVWPGRSAPSSGGPATCPSTVAQPRPPTPHEDVTTAQRRCTVLQWAIPTLTGAALIVNARIRHALAAYRRAGSPSASRPPTHSPIGTPTCVEGRGHADRQDSPAGSSGCRSRTWSCGWPLSRPPLDGAAHRPRGGDGAPARRS
jgi:hypothetical protein